MLVYPDGTFIGTVGGGDLEHRVIDEAWMSLASGKPRMLHYNLADPTRGDPASVVDKWRFSWNRFSRHQHSSSSAPGTWARLWHISPSGCNTKWLSLTTVRNSAITKVSRMRTSFSSAVWPTSHSV